MGFLGSGAAIAYMGMEIIVFSHSPLCLVFIAVAAIPAATLVCTMLGKAIGEKCMERKLPNLPEDAAVRLTNA